MSEAREITNKLIDQARKEDRILYSNSIAGKFYFTPDELAKENEAGRFIWGENFRLIHKIEMQRSIIESIKDKMEKIDSDLKWLESTLK